MKKEETKEKKKKELCGLYSANVLIHLNCTSVAHRS